MHTVVVHESSLPEGRGWSPVTWQVLEGINRIPVSMLEATDGVDEGPVHKTAWMELSGFELLSEIRQVQADVTLRLIGDLLDGFPVSVSNPIPQVGAASYYKRRTPSDSELDVERTLLELFPLLRTVDNKSYPAFFEINGRRYRIQIDRESLE